MTDTDPGPVPDSELHAPIRESESSSWRTALRTAAYEESAYRAKAAAARHSAYSAALSPDDAQFPSVQVFARRTLELAAAREGVAHRFGRAARGYALALGADPAEARLHAFNAAHHLIAARRIASEVN